MSVVLFHVALASPQPEPLLEQSTEVEGEGATASVLVYTARVRRNVETWYAERSSWVYNVNQLIQYDVRDFILLSTDRR